MWIKEILKFKKAHFHFILFYLFIYLFLRGGVKNLRKNHQM